MLSVKPRTGFALPELMIAVIVLTVVGGSVYNGLRRQQQVFRSIAAMVAVRGDVRDAAEVLAADLSTVSPLDTLPVARDSAVEMYSTIAATVSCDSAPTYTIRIPPEKMERRLLLTTLLATPDSGDVLLLYIDDSAATLGAPRWERHTIAAVGSQPSGSSCPPATGFTTAGDATAPALVFTLRGPAGSGVRAGAPIRVLRRNRYSLYRSSDSRWYLGSRRCNAFGPSACNVVQPVSGPYAGYSAAGESGLSLRFFDGQNVLLSSSAAKTHAARIELAVRARSDAWLHPGRAGLPFRDSASMSVALRNRD